jgi:hypothetical protein
VQSMVRRIQVRKEAPTPRRTRPRSSALSPVSYQRASLARPHRSGARLPPAACRLPPAACRLPPAACRLPPAACRLPPAACRLPPAACRLPPAKAFCRTGKTQCPGSTHCAQHGHCRYSNCSATGIIDTNTLIYTQDFMVTSSMTCGPDVTSKWTQQLTVTGATTRTSTVSRVVYNT